MPIDEDPLPPEDIPSNSPVRIYSSNVNAAISSEATARIYSANINVASSNGESFRSYSTFVMVAISIENALPARGKHHRSFVMW